MEIITPVVRPGSFSGAHIPSDEDLDQMASALAGFKPADRASMTLDAAKIGGREVSDMVVLIEGRYFDSLEDRWFITSTGYHINVSAFMREIRAEVERARAV